MRPASAPTRLAILLLLALAPACGDDDGGGDAEDGGDDMSADAGDGDGADDGGDGDGDGDGDDDGGDADGGPVPLCGGLAGLQCETGEYCDYDDDSCGIADSAGTCKPTPDECEPGGPKVCACNGEAYENACAAAMAGSDVSATGSCARLAP